MPDLRHQSTYVAPAERSRRYESRMQDGYYWSTAKSAAFLIAVILTALLLAGLLRSVVELA